MRTYNIEMEFVKFEGVYGDSVTTAWMNLRSNQKARDALSEK
jgi:hypothetical protein